MGIDLVNYELKTRNAIKVFWESREAAKQKQLASGNQDQGERGSVTGGKNMDGFIELIKDVVNANGLAHAQIFYNRAALTLPGYFRPTKLWDFLVLYKGELIAAIELKSQVGPSFGNNFNNRSEEAIGTAHDFWTAYREGAFGKQPRPYVGWLMVVEDAKGSRSQVDNKSNHFHVCREFKSTSYLQRYDILCQRLAREQLYTMASLVATPKSGRETGQFVSLSSMTSIGNFVVSLAGHIATQAARLG